MVRGVRAIRALYTEPPYSNGRGGPLRRKKSNLSLSLLEMGAARARTSAHSEAACLAASISQGARQLSAVPCAVGVISVGPSKGRSTFRSPQPPYIHVRELCRRSAANRRCGGRPEKKGAVEGGGSLIKAACMCQCRIHCPPLLFLTFYSIVEMLSMPR